MRVWFKILILMFMTLAISGNKTGKNGHDSPPYWITLGTSGGPAVQAERSQIANALVVNNAVYLFDVGNGVQRQMAIAGLDEKDIEAIFITHHHLDHNADLGPLMVAHWTFASGFVSIVGPEGTAALAEGLGAANVPTLLAAFPTSGPAKPPIMNLFNIIDLPGDITDPVMVFEDENIRVHAIGVDHFQVPSSIPLDRMPQCVAYRIEAGGRTIVFSGDTGPSSRLARLSKGADLLVTEIVEPQSIAENLRRTMGKASPALCESIISGMTKNHLTGAEIGKMATAAGVKEIVLTHFVPTPEDSTDQDAFTRDLKSLYHGKFTMAKDLDRF